MSLQHGWPIKDGYVLFGQPDAAATAAAKDAPSLGLISNALLYAKELERIV